MKFLELNYVDFVKNIIFLIRRRLKRMRFKLFRAIMVIMIVKCAINVIMLYYFKLYNFRIA